MTHEVVGRFYLKNRDMFAGFELWFHLFAFDLVDQRLECTTHDEVGGEDDVARRVAMILATLRDG